MNGRTDAAREAMRQLRAVSEVGNNTGPLALRGGLAAVLGCQSTASKDRRPPCPSLFSHTPAPCFAAASLPSRLDVAVERCFKIPGRLSLCLLYIIYSKRFILTIKIY